jgi:hypothetical protein
VAKTVEEKDQEIRKNISTLIDELRATTRSSKIFKEFKDLSFQDQKSEIKEKLKEFKKSDVGSAFTDMVKEVFKRDAKTEKELKEKQESIKNIREQIQKNVNLFEADEYQKLLDQIELSDVALKQDFERKYSMYNKITGIFNKKSLDSLAIFSAIAARSPMLGLGIKATGMVGGMMMRGVQNLSGYGEQQEESPSTKIREQTIINLQKKLKTARKDPVEKTTVRTPRPVAAERESFSGETKTLLEKILYASEETYYEAAESKDLLQKLFRIQEDLYTLEEMKLFDELERDKENHELLKKIGDGKGTDFKEDVKSEKGTSSLGFMKDLLAGIATAGILGGILIKQIKDSGVLGEIADGIKDAVKDKFSDFFFDNDPDKKNIREGSRYLPKNLKKDFEYILGLDDKILMEPVRIAKESILGVKDSALEFLDEKKMTNIEHVMKSLESRKALDPSQMTEKEKARNEKRMRQEEAAILKMQKSLLEGHGFKYKEDIERNQKILDLKFRSKEIETLETPLGIVKPKKQEKQYDSKLEQVYDAVALAETGGEKDPFVRTKVTDGAPSSAYGPVQITYSLAEGHLDQGLFKEDPEMEEYVKKFIDQGKKFIHYSQGKINDSRFAPGGKGELLSAEDEENYKKMAMKIMEKDLNRVGGDTSRFAREWRFGQKDAYLKSDDKYFAKIENALAKSMSSSDDQISVEQNRRPSNVINLSKSNEEMRNKQMAQNNVSVKNVSNSPPPGNVNGPSSSPGVTSVRNTDSTIARIMDKNYRGTAS